MINLWDLCFARSACTQLGKLVCLRGCDVLQPSASKNPAAFLKMGEMNTCIGVIYIFLYGPSQSAPSQEVEVSRTAAFLQCWDQEQPKEIIMRCLIKWAFEPLKGGGTPAPFFLSEKLAGKSAKVIRGEKK